MSEILKPPSNYSGSKDKILNQLLEHFPKPEEVERFYDVFAGGLSVSINTNYKKTIANDIISPLINFYINLKKAADENNIEEEIQKILSYKIDKNSPEQFNKVREDFNNSFDPYLFFSLVSSCTNNMMRFNKKFKFNQTFGKRTINDNTIEKIRKYCNALKGKDIQFTNYHFSNLFTVLTPSKDDFVYLDPPYNITEAGYNAFWSKENEDYLYRVLDSLDGLGIKFALSGVSIHKGIENPYMDILKKYKIIEINHDYEKVARKKNLGDSKEILVINY
jgi:DNA adenine methylase Dam